MRPLALAALMLAPAAAAQTLPSPEVVGQLAGNPLLAEFAGPYGGVPAFDQMDLADLEPALQAGMAAHLAELDAIAGQDAAPTFDNTIVAMERAGRPLDRAFRYYGIWSSNLSSPEFREIQGRLSPQIAAYSSAITQNAALFARVASLYDRRDALGLRPDQLRLLTLTYDGFARDGARLAGADKARYAEIEARLAELYTQFSQNVLADEEGYALFLTDDQLSGLPESFVTSARAAAEARGQDGVAVLNTRSSMGVFLTFSDERDLRERVWRTYVSRGDNGDAHDNNAVIAEVLQLRQEPDALVAELEALGDNGDAHDNNAVIAEVLQLRHERVGLLGYDDYASWRLEDRMAGTPERARALLDAVWPAAVARIAEEVADMQALADRDADAAGTERFEIAPWDYRYYAEQVRRDRYALDSDELKQYLQLGNLTEAMHWVAGELFGYAFTPVETGPAAEGKVPVFHPDVSVYHVTDRDGASIGLWYLDPYARPGKRSGAWATSYRGHHTLDGEPTLILSSNNSNFVPPAPGEPALVSLDDAETFFHEFGHALHTLSSSVAYPGLDGAVRDFVEFQSQLLERWLLSEPVVSRFLVNADGEPIPAALIEKVRRAETFNQGFATGEYLASALLDLAFHTTDPASLDPDAFERETLAALGMPGEIVARHRAPHFGHVFSGEGYSAGYYSYLWADVLTADAAEAFTEAPGGLYDEDVAARLVETLFSPRNAVDPAEAYRAFRGRDATVAPLLRARGFPVPGE